jgi:pilus assembly protein CpaB
MRPKTLILTIVAVACGLGASYMTAQLLAHNQSEPAETTEFLVARRNLNMADVIRRPEEMFELKSFTRDNQPIGGISKFEDVKGRILKVSRRAGDAIHPDDMYAETDPAWGVSTHLPKGYRAVGLRVTLEGGAHGWATLPLSHVDVIDTVRRGDDKSSYSHFLLENVLVLAIDGNPTREESGKPTPGNIVMFALSPDDCLRLSLARDTGTLSLALRNQNDNDKSGSGVVTMSELQRPDRPAAAGDEAVAEAKIARNNPIGQAVPSLPIIDRTAVQPAVEVKVAEPKGPEGTPHRMVVREGTASTTVRYLLDKSGHPIEADGDR